MLKGFVLLNKSKLVNPKAPFKKDTELINYELDSEEEVLELQGEDVDISLESSMESFDVDFSH
jgi:hypothetical protein